jgi:hypothetical protein
LRKELDWTLHLEREVESRLGSRSGCALERRGERGGSERRVTLDGEIIMDTRV